MKSKLRFPALEKKCQQYREWIKHNPPPVDENSGQELKECLGCYCQMSADNGYDFCFDCLDCAKLKCGDYDPSVGNCCACYGKKRGDPNLKRKQLTATQKQLLHWEQVKQEAEDQIEEIKEQEDPNDELTAKRIEDVHRWTEQSKQWTLKNLTLTELYQEIERRKLDAKK